MVRVSIEGKLRYRIVGDTPEEEAAIIEAVEGNDLFYNQDVAQRKVEQINASLLAKKSSSITAEAA